MGLLARIVDIGWKRLQSPRWESDAGEGWCLSLGGPHGADPIPACTWGLTDFLLPCRLPYAGYFGGVSGLSKSQFLKINGFPNEYWGWGGEDDDIFNR